ncbi:HAD hydrolase family protein, partial [Clostridium sporogenes]|uniref:HAD hydrolase family protein n=1 Tax=Clostridium sporogenes TaxID=1509 RepID=UPI0022381D0B
MKLIALDLDGTLLNNKSIISKKNAEAIKYAQDKGIEITISTGRPHFDVCSICKKANISTHIIGSICLLDKTGMEDYYMDFINSLNPYLDILRNNNIVTP